MKGVQETTSVSFEVKIALLSVTRRYKGGWGPIYLHVHIIYGTVLLSINPPFIRISSMMMMMTMMICVTSSPASVPVQGYSIDSLYSLPRTLNLSTGCCHWRRQMMQLCCDDTFQPAKDVHNQVLCELWLWRRIDSKLVGGWSRNACFHLPFRFRNSWRLIANFAPLTKFCVMF